MGEAHTGVGHETLNPFGVRIRVSKMTLRTLSMRNCLIRDKATGLQQIKSSAMGVITKLERTTYHRELYASLGPDFSGPSVVICPCKECSDKMDLSDSRISDIRTRQIVRDVTSKRKLA